MHKAVLGKTGLQVTQLGFGGIKLPQHDDDMCAEALNTALDLGINYVDTARSYNDSEAKIGRAISHRRDEFHIATKSYARPASDLRRDIETSLSELRMDRVDVFQLHSVSDEDSWRQVMAKGGALEAARKAQTEGLVDHIGLSIHRDLGVMKKAVECGEFETVMVCYSVLDTECVAPEILPLIERSDIGCVIMKALSGGMLVSEGFEEGQRGGDEDPLVSACLRYVMSHPAVDTVIPGMRNADEVRQNVRMADAFQPMTPKEKEALIRDIGARRGAFRYGQVCLQCGYCRPCPQGLNIPEVFRAQMIMDSYPDGLKATGRALYEGLDAKPDVCLECGKCVAKCPAGIDIPARLREAQTVLERA